MTKDIRLYIGGMQVDFKQTPEILYNWVLNDLTNPTIVKNSFSKTLEIEGTPANNAIFGHFADSSRIVGMSGFNASKKSPFELYVDSELRETGYVRLDGVNVNGEKVTYSITLYGGLGDFFYNLHYNLGSSGDEGRKTLADLHYIDGSDSQSEFDFKINKDSVQEAWDTLGSTGNTLWHNINFMPAYNGTPDDFDADKVLINFNQSELISAVTSGTSAYTSYSGYALATMAGKHTENEMREFRSYLQRPCINVKKVIEACCKPENNGGYSVYLDDYFFNEDNPYWTDTWMTLPMLNTFENLSSEELTGTTATLGNITSSGGRNERSGYYEWRDITISGDDYTPENTYSLDVSLKLRLNSLVKASAGNTVAPNVYLNFFYDPEEQYASCIIMQLVAYDSLGTAVAGSDAINLTSEKNPGYYPNIDLWGYSYPYGNRYVNSIGSFRRIGDTRNVEWDKPLSLTINNVPYGATVKLVIKKYGAARGYYGRDYGFYVNEVLWGTLDGINWVPYAPGGDDWTFDVTADECVVSAIKADGVRTGTKFHKSDILSTDYSPADFLLSYCKLFGLYFSKDLTTDTIYIDSRERFYNKTNIKNLADVIDRGSQRIKPVLMDSKWVDFKLESDETELVNKYADYYGQPYGIQRVNTGYDFNAESKNLLDGNIFRGGIECVEKSQSFSVIDDDIYKPWMLDGYKYTLYSAGTTDVTTSVTYEEESTLGVLQGFTDNYKYYDLFSLMQFHSEDNSPEDGSKVLVFYNGKHNTLAKTANLKYWITDDNSYMYALNDSKSCWLWTCSSQDSAGNTIAIRVDEIPQFGRYRTLNSGRIYKSLDFGEPKQLFIPWLSTVGDSTIYTQFWKNFVSDIYSPDTRVLTVGVNIDKKIDFWWFRCFWWFDNSIWRLNTISDCNIADYGLTQMEFVKVQDINNYGLDLDFISEHINITSEEVFPASSEASAYTFSLETESLTPWYLEYPTWVTPSVTGGTGSTTFTLTLSANTSGAQRLCTLRAVGELSAGEYQFYQAGYFRVVSQSPTNMILPRTGGWVHMSVRSTTNWRVWADGPVTQLAPTTGHSSTFMVDASISENNTFVNRLITFHFKDANNNTADLVYTQLRKEPVINFTPSAITASAGGGWYTSGELSYNVPDHNITIDCPEWCSVTLNGWQASGSTYINEPTIIVSQNISQDARQGVITFSNGEVSTTFTVNQEGSTLMSYSVYGTNANRTAFYGIESRQGGWNGVDYDIPTGYTYIRIEAKAVNNSENITGLTSTLSGGSVYTAQTTAVSWVETSSQTDWFEPDADGILVDDLYGNPTLWEVSKLFDGGNDLTLSFKANGKYPPNRVIKLHKKTT